MEIEKEVSAMTMKDRTKLMFAEALEKILEMNAEEMSAVLSEKTPDFMKTAFAGYSYKSDEILDSDK